MAVTDPSASDAQVTGAEAGSPSQPGAVRGHPAGAAAASSAKVTAGTATYVTRPTRWTLFLRTFVPWQLWRFARINAKMIRIIRGSRS